MKIKIMLLVLIGVRFSSIAHAENTQGQLPLQKQYETVIAQSNNFKEYKVIKSSLLSGLWKNTNDSIKSILKIQAEAKQIIHNQQQEIKTLKENLNSQGISLQQSQSKIDSISILGISVAKGNYNTLMWGVIFALGAALSFFVFKIKAFETEATYRISLFHDLNEEFKEYKTKAMEKEKRLARELQTERNNLEEMLLQQKL